MQPLDDGRRITWCDIIVVSFTAISPFDVYWYFMESWCSIDWMTPLLMKFKLYLILCLNTNVDGFKARKYWMINRTPCSNLSIWTLSGMTPKKQNGTAQCNLAIPTSFLVKPDKLHIKRQKHQILYIQHAYFITEFIWETRVNFSPEITDISVLFNFTFSCFYFCEFFLFYKYMYLQMRYIFTHKTTDTEMVKNKLNDKLSHFYRHHSGSWGPGPGSKRSSLIRVFTVCLCSCILWTNYQWIGLFVQIL